MSKKYNISFNIESDRDTGDIQAAIWSILQTGVVVDGSSCCTASDIDLPCRDHIVVKEVDEEFLPFKLYVSRINDHPTVEADAGNATAVCAAKTLSKLYTDIYHFRDNGYNVTVRYEPYKERVWRVVYDWHRWRSIPWINNDFFRDNHDLL